MSARAYQPLVIVGAARSGTNVLRDCLTSLPGFATWDCDEINPVWMHGHFFRSDDELERGDLTASGRRTIRRAFARIAAGAPDARFIVEKTCANSLRLGFVDAALDDARFIQIVRDGRAVVPSAAKRWRGEFELDARDYFLAKARNTPLTDLPLYAFAFARARFRKLLGKSDRLQSWGPRYRGMAEDMGRPLDDICARQWAHSVERSDRYLESLPADRWLRVHYEDFVADPRGELERVLAFLGVGVSEEVLATATQSVRRPSGTARALPPAAAISGDPLFAAVLRRHGYEKDAA